jgi:hypothetical protein
MSAERRRQFRDDRIVPVICPPCQNVLGDRPKHPYERMLCYFAWGCFRHFTFGTSACDKLTRRTKFRFSRRPNHLYDSRHPVPEEGALAIVTERWDGMRWTRRHRARGWGCRAGFITCERSTACRRAVPKRAAKSCGPDASVVGVKSCGGAKGPTGPTCHLLQDDGGKKARYSGVSTHKP